jgi:hypothetical protein
LRRRGALVFILLSGSGVRRVLRVATNPFVSTLARRNQKVTGELRSRPTVTDSVRELIPAPLGSSSNESVQAFAEDFRPGRLAWTLYRNERCRRRIDQDLFRFSHGLQLQTRYQTTLNGPQLERLIDGFVQPIQERLGHYPPARDSLGRIASRLHTLLSERVMFLCSGQGDFGVGNALATPEGAVTGIIDWDQYQEHDLPGLDWCDHCLKANHFKQSVSESLPQLVNRATSAGWLDPEHTGFGSSDFGLKLSDMRLIPCLAALREMSRAARFPGELSRPQEQYAALLELVGHLLPQRTE